MTVLTICSDESINNIPFGKWYHAKYIGEYLSRKDKVYIVQRVRLTINGYKDCVIYLDPNHIGYDTFDTFKNNYELIKEVEEIVVK